MIMPKSFLETIVEKVLSRNTPLSQFCFVMPNRRAGQTIHQLFSAKLTATTLGPEVLGIDEFVERLSGLKVMPTMDQYAQLYRSYKNISSKNHDSFGVFLGWGSTLLNDLDAIDRNLIPHENIFSYLKALHEIREWGRDETSVVKNYINFWNQCPDIYADFSSRIKKKGFGTSGMCYREAVENIEFFIQQSYPTEIIFCGFNALTTSESQLIQELLAQERATVFWDIDRQLLHKKGHKAGHYLRNYQQKWSHYKHNPMLGLHEAFSAKKKVTIIETQDTIGQSKQIGELLLQLADAQISWEKTALVLGDEKMLTPLLHVLPEHIPSVNITMGQPLDQQPLSVCIDALFDFQHSLTTKGGFYKHVEILLLHQYIRPLFQTDNKFHGDDWINAIRQENQVYISEKYLTDKAPKTVRSTLHLLFSPWGTCDKAVDAIIAILHHVMHQFKTPLLCEVLHRFLELFYQLKRLVTEFSNEIDLAVLRSLYNELIRKEQLHFEGVPLGGLQIMGMLETRVLDFDTVILTSANEGVLPKSSLDNSWIPYEVKKQFGLPTREENDVIYTYHFYRLMFRAKRIFILYTNDSEGLGSAEKSRFIRQWEFDSPTNHQFSYQFHQPTLQLDEQQLKQIPKSQGAIQRLISMAKKGFSPSSLTKYIRNPIDFYEQNMLGVKDELEVDESLAATTYGSVLHDTIEALYQPYIGQVLTEEILLKIRKNISITIPHYFEKHYKNRNYQVGKNLLVFASIERSLENVISLEINEIKSGKKISVLALEETIELELRYPELDFPIHLKGTIDRVDLVDEQLRITDYKTGKVEPSDLKPQEMNMLIETPKYGKAFQLLFYALLWHDQKHPVAEISAGIISFKNLSKKWMPVHVKDYDQGVNQELIMDFKDQLKRLILELFNPTVDFQEKEII